MAWSAAQYVKFEGERTRAARDLLAQVPDLPAGSAYDLGCGPGNSTELLAERFANRQTIGIDSDENMLAAARKRLPGITFDHGDLSVWTPPVPAALLFANAVFQWVPGHISVFERLMDHLVPGGVLAVQMPDNRGEPNHTEMDAVTDDPRWAGYFAASHPRRPPLPPTIAYFDALSKRAARVDIWHTIYNHPMEDAAAIVEWVKGTGIRPYLEKLPDEEQPGFLESYRQRIEKAYPQTADGRVLLRFPRLFLVAVKA
ncbi:trans-aconitate 2-methyltransferase [Rhizobium subbaraonis]|uniref:Trans-aconitate 2-methyltransferase n=1 Tax=Rhizobium subbaraonis TaxID=908946 RepID=A0A285U0F7_9HYPH|nr:trans-aconitate 2-methyltransferase [Rhizobium subbaraonis]SOC35414.1 trans-aconitate 2-methyltransferase [Rhizobium subbaraonis]